MKLTQLLITTSLCAATASPSLAQGRPFYEIDTNGDNALSLSELEAVFGTASAARLMARADSNRDGTLSQMEIRNRNDDESDDDERSGNDDEEGDDEEDDDRGSRSGDDEEDDDERRDRSDEDDDEEDDDERRDRSDDEEDDED